MRRISTIALVALIATPAFAVTITLNDGGPSFIRSTAYDGGTANDSETYNPTSLPSSGTAEAGVGGSSATTDNTLSNAGFELSFDNARTGTTNAYSESNGSLNFSVDANSGYVLEGVYTAIDADGRWTGMEVHLYDRTAGDYLFRNLQRSNATPDESFTLGLEDGDLSPVLVGFLTGNLLAGHQYQLYFRMDIWNSAGEDTMPATASGTLSLAFVPEFIACGDGIDNDGDGLTDFVGGDPGCADSEDLSENDPTLPCDDGADNDGHGRIDFDPVTFAHPGDVYTLPSGSGDPGCNNPSSGSESPQCQDGINNDLGQDPDLIDFDGGQSIHGYCSGGICPPGVSDPDEDGVADPDPQCVGQPWRNAERAPQSACGLGVELAFLLPPLMWLWQRRRREGV